MSCHIIQVGSDGFGHQLYGLFSTLILHNVKNYYFDGIRYCNKRFQFQHISSEQSELMKKYLVEAITNFSKDHNQNQNQKNYLTYIFAHEIYKIPDDYNKNILYGIDNAYYFDKINLNDEEVNLHIKNIEKYKKYFIDNKYLPPNRLDKNNIVIHIRLGDALLYPSWKDSIDDFNSKVVKLLDKLVIDYPDYTIYIHSNGEPDFLKRFNYIFYGNSTSLIRVLSDLIHAKIFVCGSSGLSKVCAFLGNHELTIIPDDTKHSMPFDCIKMSNYFTK